MIKIKGKAVSGGIAIGKIMFLKKNEREIEAKHSENERQELDRYRQAVEKAVLELNTMIAEAKANGREDAAEIFEIHQMMLFDKEYVTEIEEMITKEKWISEYAVEETSKKFSQAFLSMDSEYMRGRAADVMDVSDRIIRLLSGGMEEDDRIGLDKEKIILCADDLTPSETVRLDKNKVVAFATKGGTAQSHTAIIAGTMNLPAIIALGNDLSEEYDGMTAVADGVGGYLYVNPPLEFLEDAKERCRKEKLKRERLRQLKGMKNITEDGREIMVYANIGTPTDVDEVLDNDGGGIGLFRSEFLYLKSKNFPTEEEQFNAYKSVLKKMGDKRVIIRTMDIGADKQIAYFGLDIEENPALGYRAIRICLTRREIFKTQLKALFRASAFGKLGIMIPMVISLEEVLETKKIIEEVKAELKYNKIEFDEKTEFGIMIETPAAVMISDDLAKEVDFFSIGTNDLTQYSLAIDRQNPQVEAYYNPRHKALMRMIHKTVENAHKEGIWCGVCGELAANLDMTEQLLAMGVDEFSVSPPHILSLREKIRSVNIKKITKSNLDIL